MILLFSLFNEVVADLLPMDQPDPYPEDTLPGDNILVGALWAMGICTCVGIVCNHDSPPITIIPTKEYSVDEEEHHFQIKSNKDYSDVFEHKQKMRKLKRDLRQLQTVLGKLDK